MGDKTATLIENIVTIIVVLLVIAAFIGLILLMLNKFAGVKVNIFGMFGSVDKSVYKDFDNVETTGQNIKAFLSANQEADIGVIVITKKEKGVNNGLNYLRPLSPADTDPTDEATEVPYDTAVKGVYKNSVITDATDKWDEKNEFTGVFTSESSKYRSTNYKYMNKVGGKHQILDDAKFNCKLIVDNKKVIGFGCYEK